MKVDGFLFDLNGVFFEDNRLIFGANETIHWLRGRKLPFKFISNNTTLSRQLYVEKLNKLGLEVSEHEVLSANYAGVVVAEKLGIQNCRLVMEEQAKKDYAFLQQANKKVDAIIVGDIGNKWSVDLMNSLMLDILDGAEIIALHKGRYYQSNGRLKIDCGAFVAGLEYVTQKKAHVVGKPSKTFFEVALADMPSGTICIVGDDLINDIQGGIDMGLKTILVKTGKFREEIFQRSVVKPDLCIPSIKQLKEIIE